MSVIGNPYANSAEMYKIHTMFRREFALLPGLIGSVPATDEERVRAVVDHIRLLCDLLHDHHSAEDVVLWPRLLVRVPKEVDPVMHLMEDQHRSLDDLLAELGRRLGTWRDGTAGDNGEALALTLRRLAVVAIEHMTLEERLVLPLFEGHIFASEWEEMGQIAVPKITPENGPVMAGMMMYEEGPESVPARFPAALLEAAPKAYAAYCQRLHGTPAPPRSTELVISTPFVGVASEVARLEGSVRFDTVAS